MNSIQIMCFLEAARCSNFTKAAHALFITQPALSHNISTLEEEWGVKLFQRSNKKKDIELTPAGKKLYESMLKLKETYEENLHRAQLVDSGKTGELRIGLINSELLSSKIYNALNRFQLENPDIEISLKSSGYNQLLQELDGGKLDCIIIMEALVADNEDVEYRSLFSARSLMIMHKDNPLAAEKNLSFSDCWDQTFLNVSQSESPIMHQLLLNGCRKAGIVPKVLDVPDLQTQMLYLEAGKGIAIGSENNRCLQINSMVGVSAKGLVPRNFVLAKAKKPNPCVDQFYRSFE